MIQSVLSALFLFHQAKRFNFKQLFKSGIQNCEFYNKKHLQMNPVPEPIQVLTKKQQSKQQKSNKASEAGKSRTHAKSYKRKAKGRHPQQCAQRKLIKVMVKQLQTEAEHGQEDSEQNNFSTSGLKDKLSQQQADKKKKLKQFKPFNTKTNVNGGTFRIQTGQEGLFAYIMTYSYVEKTKKMDAPAEDPSFLDQFEGEPLQLMDTGTRKDDKSRISAEFEMIKQKIQVPFDQIHKKFTRKISGLTSKEG